MTEPGHGLQVVDVTKSHSYVLAEEELATLLLRDDVKELPVVVVSVAGAYRGGKSFLLNFFIRYLSAPESSRRDGSWLGEDSAPLVGFNWRSGRKATTMGVLLWSEPFITSLPSGEKVAILLVDTQGNFDNRSTVKDNSTIFGLSTLLSSVQIYNISQNIKEDDLQNLELFTEYGKLAKSTKGDNSKPFQVLEFLVRDWPFGEETPFGAVGGETLLHEKFEITEDLAKEMKELREHILASFEKVSCFLMPHPGFNVLSINYHGNVNEINPKFRLHLLELVNSLFSSEKLITKKINGKQIKARELFNYFKTYVELFNSDEIPDPTNILAATVKAGLLSAVGEARDVYEKSMDDKAGPKQPGVPATELKEFHKKSVNEAKNYFNEKIKMGTAKEATDYLQKLTKELDERLPQFLQSNLSKIQAAVNQARDAYKKAVEAVCKGKLLCVHPKDVEKIHKTALDAALKVYDGLVKRTAANNDNASLNFKKEYDLLRRENEKNNKSAISDLRMAYWQRMQAKAMQDPPLTEIEFKSEHKKELELTLKDFDSKRIMANQYTEDVYKYQVTEACLETFITLKAMNKSKNKSAMQAGVNEYDQYMKNFANNSSQCMHPDDLEETHTIATCRALTAFHPQKECSLGFDDDDEDEKNLKEILSQRYSDYKKNNEESNENAVQLAYNTYVTDIDDKCRFSGWWVLGVPYLKNLSDRNDFHKDSKKLAIDKFYAQRRDGATHSIDPFKARLETMIEEYYNKEHKTVLQKFGEAVVELADTIMLQIKQNIRAKV